MCGSLEYDWTYVSNLEKYLTKIWFYFMNNNKEYFHVKYLD